MAPISDGHADAHQIHDRDASSLWQNGRELAGEHLAATRPVLVARADNLDGGNEDSTVLGVAPLDCR